MPGFDLQLAQFNNDDYEYASVDYMPSSYYMLYLLASLLVAYTMARVAESKNNISYESRTARITAGFITIMSNLLHAKSDDFEIINPENTIFTLGTHRTSFEAAVFATKFKCDKSNKCTPPRFWATDGFDGMPGIKAFMKMFKVIPIKANAKRTANGSANAQAIEDSSKVLSEEKGCVVLFPQGNMARIGQEPPKIYTGAAQLALKNKLPIKVIRLDGFWCLQNRLIPLVIRNNVYYRAFFAMFHMNNIRFTLCCEIDFHLRPENQHLSDEKKIEEICAQLYAYYKYTDDLKPQQITCIKTEIESGRHFRLWGNKVRQDALRKEGAMANIEALLRLKAEEAELAEPTLAAMSRFA
jgi:1-acyl-sn-glycerol-3-phosphate acyltransferase